MLGAYNMFEICSTGIGIKKPIGIYDQSLQRNMKNYKGARFFQK